ncbi:alpha/beta fold hydrolase [Nonomuraea wenchangensis]|uniref:alpha/beta fold hydrolase n=1 Tax=Nonomuraea sp. LP-02 TaxID=3097960 RepID=UPI00369C5FAB
MQPQPAGCRTSHPGPDRRRPGLDSVDLGRCVLVGHSLGGPICRLLTYRRPELVAGLVLVDQDAEDREQSSHRPLARLGNMGAPARRRLYRRFRPR